MTRLALITAALLSAACTPDLRLTADTYFRVHGDYAQLDAVRMAVAQLDTAVPYDLTVGRPATRDARLETWDVYFDAPCGTVLPNNVTLCVDADAGTNWDSRATWIAVGADTAGVVAHELGHVVGLYTDGTHADDGVMVSPTPADSFEYTREELAAIRALY